MKGYSEVFGFKEMETIGVNKGFNDIEGRDLGRLMLVSWVFVLIALIAAFIW